MATNGQRMLRRQEPRVITVEDRRALLQRVLWSPQIAKSSRIREFLAYVCERALQDPSIEIHEQEIGCRVFGRSADYDTSADNIVRVTASQARKRLEQYFSSQGATEPSVLEIPKGGYTPVFRERDAAAENVELAQPQERLAASRPLIVAAIALPWLLLAIGSVFWVLSNPLKTGASELDTSPSLKDLWSQLLPPGGRTDLVVTDSGLSLALETEDRQPTLQEYLANDFWIRRSPFASNPDLQHLVERMGQSRLSSLAGLTAAFRVAELAVSSRTRVSIVSPRDFNIHQMKTDSVVLLGSSGANPWVGLLEDKLTFQFGYDRVARFAYFENRDPRSGELKTYRCDSNVSYCRIAFLPNLAQTGNIIAICGGEVVGTEGGGEFVTNEHSLHQLRSFMNLGSGRFPYFEVLLKSSKVGGSTPGFAPVAFRLLHP